MAEPSNMVVPSIREMRAEIASRLDGIDARLEALEKGQVSFRQALAGDNLMSKLVTGDFEERIEALERRVRQLESRS
jgi:polyhydroxyalkanoate synthesis regulator phasin